MTIAKADFIEGIAKGMAVLESFDTERQRLNATLAAARAGITRAAARRHLLTLAHLGYLETDGSYFWMSPKVLRFSGSYLASSRLPRALQPTLNRLAAQTGESFSAVVLDGESVGSLDVSAARMLFRLDQTLRERGVRLVFAHGIGQVRDVLGVLAPGQPHLELHESIDAAVAAVSSRPES